MLGEGGEEGDIGGVGVGVGVSVVARHQSSRARRSGQQRVGVGGCVGRRKRERKRGDVGARSCRRGAFMHFVVCRQTISVWTQYGKMEKQKMSDEIPITEIYACADLANEK